MWMMNKINKYVFLALYFIPTIVGSIRTAVVCYIKIFKAIQKISKTVTSLSHRSKARLVRDKKLTKLFATISILLIVLILPQAVVKPMFYLLDRQKVLYINDIANAIALTNSSINPLLYLFFIKQCKRSDGHKESISSKISIPRQRDSVGSCAVINKSYSTETKL